MSEYNIVTKGEQCDSMVNGLGDHMIIFIK